MDEGMYLIALSLIESGDLNPEQAGQTAKAICHKFVSANRCQCCGGAERSGSIKRAGISSSARSAAGLGVTLKSQVALLFDVLLSGLYEYESIAERKLKERLV